MGIVATDARVPAVVVGNVLGGYTLLAVLAAAWAASVIPPVSRTALSRLARVALVLVLVDAVLGLVHGSAIASPEHGSGDIAVAVARSALAACLVALLAVAGSGTQVHSTAR